MMIIIMMMMMMMMMMLMMVMMQFLRKTLLVRPRKELKLESYEVSGSVRKHIQKSTTMSLLCFSLYGEMKN